MLGLGEKLHQEHHFPVARGGGSGGEAVRYGEKEKEIKELRALNRLGHLNRGFLVIQVPFLAGVYVSR